MEKIKDRINRFIDLWDDDEIKNPLFLQVKEAKQILSNLEWKGCNSCTDRITPVNSFPVCRNLKSVLNNGAFVDETTSCIYHTKIEEK